MKKACEETVKDTNTSALEFLRKGTQSYSFYSISSLLFIVAMDSRDFQIIIMYK